MMLKSLFTRLIDRDYVTDM